MDYKRSYFLINVNTFKIPDKTGKKQVKGYIKDE